MKTMKKRFLATLIILALIFTLTSASVRSIVLENIVVKDVAMYDDGSLKGFKLEFYTSLSYAAAPAQVGVHMQSFAPGALSDQGTYADAHSYPVLDSSFTPEDCQFLCWSQTGRFDRKKGGTDKVDITFARGQVPLDVNQKYYVYLWTFYSGNWYPDYLIAEFGTEDNRLIYNNEVLSDNNPYTITTSNCEAYSSDDYLTKISKSSKDATVYLKAPKGYEIESCSVTDGAGGSVSVVNDTFTMPESNVEVSASIRVAPLSGTVNIASSGDSIYRYKDTLTASLSGDNNTGMLAYSWYRVDGSTETLLATGASYTVVAADIGKDIKCVVSSSVQTGAINGSTGAVAKIQGPHCYAQTDAIGTTIIDVTTDMEYQKQGDAGYTPCPGTTITNLDLNSYYLVRYKETTTHEAGANAWVSVAKKRYSIQLIVVGDGGRMSVGGVYSWPQATVDNTVTITLEPETGKAVKSISADYGSGNTPVAISGSGNTRTFTMPPGNVAVSAQFGPALTGLTLSTSTPTTAAPVTASVAPSGATASYAWYRSATNANTAGKAISGATSADYTPQHADLGKYIYCVASATGDYAGSVTSPAIGPVSGVLAAVTASTDAPTIDKPVTASAQPSGASASWKWYESASSTGSWVEIPGAGAEKYTPTAAQTGKYLKAEAAGTGSYTGSGEYILPNPVGAMPSITTQPAAQSVSAGGAAAFSIAASGSAPLTYEWQVSSDSGLNWSSAGATAASYTFSAALPQCGESYRCVVSNIYGSVTSNTAVLTVKGTKDYHWVSGQNSVFSGGVTRDFAFRSDDNSNSARLSELENVYVDGNLLTLSEDYTAAEGSVIVTLTPTYLQALPRGRHRLTVTYNTTGALSTSFTVAPPASAASLSSPSSPGRTNPDTGC